MAETVCGAGSRFCHCTGSPTWTTRCGGKAKPSTGISTVSPDWAVVMELATGTSIAHRATANDTREGRWMREPIVVFDLPERDACPPLVDRSLSMSPAVGQPRTAS